MKVLYVIDTLKRGGKERRLLELIDSLPPSVDYLILLLRDQIEFDTSTHKIHAYKGRGNKLDQLFWYTKTIITFKPDIVHSWYYECSQFSLPICKILGIKFISSEITNIKPFSKKKISTYKIIQSLIFKGANHITSNSKAGLDIYNAPRKKSSVIYNGFNFNRIKINNNLNFLEEYNDCIVILMIANFTEKKDYSTFIKAAIELLEIREDLFFVGLGHGEKYEEFCNLIPKKYKLRIIFPGFIQNVEDYIYRADIGVLVSFGEGFPNSVMEFMAFRKPVIATSGGGTNELIINNFNGILISQSNPMELARSIKFLINNPEIRKSMGDNAYTYLKENFSHMVMAEKFLQLYLSLL